MPRTAMWPALPSWTLVTVRNKHQFGKEFRILVFPFVEAVIILNIREPDSLVWGSCHD